MIRLGCFGAFALLLTMSTTGRGQSSRVKTFGITAQVGYLIPANDVYRGNYDQGYNFGSVRVPIAIVIGMQYAYTPQVSFTGDIGIFTSTLSTNENNWIRNTAFTVGAKVAIPPGSLRSLSLRPYGGAGLAIYSVSSNGSYTPVDGNGNITGPDQATTTTSVGFGLRLSAGVDYPLSASVMLGLNLAYDVNTLGAEEEGGLGNLGGLFPSAKLTVLL